MKAALPEAQIAKRHSEIDVGEVKVRSDCIARLVLSDVHVESTIGIAQLRNVVVIINPHFSLDWKVGVTIDAPFGDVDFSRSGSLSLGTLDFELGLGDIALPESKIFPSTLTFYRLRMRQRSWHHLKN